MVKKHEWLKLTSQRTQPYTIDDISVIVPSTAGRFEKRMKWFWPQYVKRTHPEVVKRTYIPCDPKEEIPGGIRIEVEPRWIVHKTIAALDQITTRLTFRLANDIMIVRKGWEDILLKQFNAEENLQIIADVQHGISYEESHSKLAGDWDFFKREYPKATTAAVYPHGARLFAQTAIYNAYYRHVIRYTAHDHDELFFSQLARGDGVQFTRFGGINLFLAHVGITNKDFTDDYIRGHIKERRREYSNAPDKHEFIKME